MFDLVIIGAGAAGFFAAAEVRKRKPDARILMLEKTSNILSKVKISGGGRCNVTHNCMDINRLVNFYPSGNPWLLPAFRMFGVAETLRWFSAHGVRLVAEDDGRMFPESNDSQTIMDALMRAAQHPHFTLKLRSGVASVSPLNGGFQVTLLSGESLVCPQILVASGGHSSENGFRFLDPLALTITPPVPSLFTFNVPMHSWKDLMGLSIPDARVELDKTGLSCEGPVLVTHWGFSGPAVLKLSAFGARILHEMQYQYSFTIDFLPEYDLKQVESKLLDFQKAHPHKKPVQSQVFPIPVRLWEKVCLESGLSLHFNWAEAGKKKIQQACRLLKGRVFQAQGKTTYKNEFVTSGGVALLEVEAETCESRRYPGLFFSGEVLDVDGVTGGFNFQAAWSTAFCAASTIAKRIKDR